MLQVQLQLTHDPKKSLKRFIMRLTRSDRSYVGFQDTKIFEKIPERIKTDGYETYDVAATDTTVNAILEYEQAGTAQIVFADEDTETCFRYIQLRHAMTNTVQSNYANFKLLKQVPEHKLVLHPELTLAGYQQVAAVNSSLSEGYGLFMEQGTGKTPVAIADACNYKRTDGSPITRVLVVCPPNVRMNWKSEFDRFSTVPHKCQVLRGGQVKRINQLVEGLHATGQELSVIIVGYETMVQSWEAISMIPWHICYLDEAHYIKSERTKRWEYVKQLRDICDRRRVLTGTPIANSLFDMYTLFEFMGEGLSGFTDLSEFKKYYGVFEQSREKGYEALVSVQNIPAMKERLARYTFSITKKEAMPDMPDKTYDIIEVEMSPEQTDAYNQLATTLAYEIEDDIEDSDNMALTINNVLVKLLKLAQVTSGFLNIPPIKDDDGNVIEPGRTIHFSPNPKIQAILDLAEEKKASPNSKTILWACWIPDIEKIDRALKAVGESPVTYYGETSFNDRQEAEYRFNNDPTCKWLIGNPAAGGTGLNLLGYPPGKPEESDTNCDHIIYVSQDWSSLKRSQSEDRGHRRGTRVPVRITDLCVPESIDETIRARVFDKRRAALELSDVREILKNILLRK